MKLDAGFGAAIARRLMDRANRLVRNDPRSLGRLTAAEVAAVYGYTTAGTFHRSLNAALRAGTPTSGQTAVASLIDAALSKLPAMRTRLYRGMALDDRSSQKFLIGRAQRARVGYPAFTSVSMFPEAAFAGHVFMRIIGKNARCAVRSSSVPREAEAILPRGTTFEVTDRRQDASGGWTFFLEEA